MRIALQGLRAALEIACILAVVSSRSVQLAGTLVLASPLAAPAIKALCSAIQVNSTTPLPTALPHHLTDSTGLRSLHSVHVSPS